MPAPHLHTIMNAQEYIISNLKKLAEPIALEDIGKTPLEEAVYAKVMSKKFRKKRANDTTIMVVKRGIKTSLEKRMPLTVSFTFGGNKLWRLEEAPEADWAELFACFYFLDWMKYIASVHPYGVVLEFYSQDVAVPTLNNISLAETNQYTNSFKSIIHWLQPHLPENISMIYKRYGDEYANYDEYLAELELAKDQILKDNNGRLPSLSPAQKIATELNVRLLPGQDNDPLWREKTELIHQALEETTTLKKYLDDPLRIRACPTDYNGWIGTGSTKRSFAKYWVGVGVLEKSGNSFNELVLTPKQLASTRFEWQEIAIPGLKGKNFNKIRILP